VKQIELAPESVKVVSQLPEDLQRRWLLITAVMAGSGALSYGLLKLYRIFFNDEGDSSDKHEK
jgi:hypothetical protein